MSGDQHDHGRLRGELGVGSTIIRAYDDCFIPAPREQVWAVVSDIGGYPAWWPSFLRVRVLREGAIGGEVEITPRNGRAFRCRVTAIDPPTSMTMEYDGPVRGSGMWMLAPEDDGTRVSYALDTHAKGWIVRAISWFVDLGGIHSAQMRAVFEGLSRRIGNRD